MKIIINADDFGYSDSVNSAIKDFCDKGLVSSSTIMANAPRFDDAARFAASFGKSASFGVHLNLTEFDPLTNSPLLKSLNLLESPARRKRFLFDARPSLAKAVEAEWSAQIEKTLSAGVNVSHLDGHNNIHWSLNLLPVLIKLQKKYGIKKTRGVKNLFTRPISSARKIYIKAWRAAEKYFANQTMADFLGDVSDFPPNCAKIGADATVELMCHPGGQYRQEDIGLLKSGEILSMASPCEIISYNEL